MVNVNHKYGTPEFYAEHFADFIGDVEGDNPATADNIVKGFLLSIDEWFDYHQQQANAYAQLRQRVRQALAV
jgi:hypothetical protein